MDTNTDHGKTDIHGHHKAGPLNGQDSGIIVNASDMTADLLPKKKRKKTPIRPSTGRGQNKPTGFEENFADTPLTAEQHAELREHYDPALPFTERILRAVHRFERTRKLSNLRRDVFYKYLVYGGFEVGPNMFQGRQDVANMDRNKAITAMAQTALSEAMRESIYDTKVAEPPDGVVCLDPPTLGDRNSTISSTEVLQMGEPYKYMIDFYTTMSAFLSRRAPTVYGLDSVETVDLVTTTLERFMDYLLQHDVCAEYRDEVLQTRNLCRDARAELTSCIEAQRWLPGDFNISCSTLFGGSYGKAYDGKIYWGDAQPGEHVYVGLTSEKATQIMGFAMAAVADEDIYQKYASNVETGGKFEVAKTINGHGFEITGIHRPTTEGTEIYRLNSSEFRPVGTIQAKFWKNPECPPEDLTKEERELRLVSDDATGVRSDLNHNFSGEKFVFFLEDSNILPYLRIGQRVECTIHQLDCGIWFFDEVLRLLPSFDQWIENELVYDWKEPKPVGAATGRSVQDENATSQKFISMLAEKFAEEGVDVVTTRDNSIDDDERDDNDEAPY